MDFRGRPKLNVKNYYLWEKMGGHFKTTYLKKDLTYGEEQVQ